MSHLGFNNSLLKLCEFTLSAKNINIFKIHLLHSFSLYEADQGIAFRHGKGEIMCLPPHNPRQSISPHSSPLPQCCRGSNSHPPTWAPWEEGEDVEWAWLKSAFCFFSWRMFAVKTVREIYTPLIWFWLVLVHKFSEENVFNKNLMWNYSSAESFLGNPALGYLFCI